MQAGVDEDSRSQPLLQTRQASEFGGHTTFQKPWYQSCSRACLSCPLSGRHNLQAFIPIVFSASCILDIPTGSMMVAVRDALIFVIANVSTPHLPISDIRLDMKLIFLLMVSWTLHTLCSELDEPDSDVDQVTVQLQPFMAICLWQASMLLLLGVRVAVLGPSLLYLFILVSFVGGLPTWLITFASTSLICCAWRREKTLDDAALDRLGNARLLEALGLCSCSLSRDMMIVEACGQLCDLYGVDSLLGAQVLDLIRSEDQEIFEARLQSLFRLEVGDTDVCVVTCWPPGGNEPFDCKLFLLRRTQQFVEVYFQHITTAGSPPAFAREWKDVWSNNSSVASMTPILADVDATTADRLRSVSLPDRLTQSLPELWSVSEATANSSPSGEVRDAEVQTERPVVPPPRGLPPRLPNRPQFRGTATQEGDVHRSGFANPVSARVNLMRPPRDRGDRLESWASSHALPRPDALPRPEIGNGGAAGFKLTSMTGLHSSILMLVKHWNVVRLPGACCPHHNALVHCRRIVKNTIKSPCQPVWAPCSAWQCHKCSCMNDNDDYICDICLTEVDSADALSRPTSNCPAPSPSLKDVAKADAVYSTSAMSSTSLSAAVLDEERGRLRTIIHDL